MRCEKCQTEVAAQVAEDGSIICGSCGTLLESGGSPQFEAQLRQAKELLERWSKEPLLEPLEPLPGKQASHLSEVEKFQAESESELEDESPDAGPESESENTASQQESDSGVMHDGECDEGSSHSQETNSGSSFEIELHEVDTPLKAPIPEISKPKFRFDAAHVPADADSTSAETPAERREPLSEEEESFDFDALDAAAEEADKEPAEPKVEETPRAEPDPVETTPTQTDLDAPAETEPAPVAHAAFRSQRIDTAQPVAVHSPPHLDIQQLIDRRLQEEKQGFNWMVFAGQWLSYLGVLGLTAGAALVVYGYFGGSPEMVPKGWMLTTAGQMLLLLGIVTLISGGLDQANSEVNTRIQVLGEQMLRFERETKEHLRGPKIPAAQYAEDAPPAEQKKTADETEES